MRPEYQINKQLQTSGQSHGYLQSSAYRTNRYLTITNNTNGAQMGSSAVSGGGGGAGGVGGSNGSGTIMASNFDNNGGQMSLLSKDAKNFHKSLRQPPKGIFLNYEELIELLQNNNRKIFNQLNRRIDSLKKQVNNSSTTTKNFKFKYCKNDSSISQFLNVDSSK